MPKIIVIGTLIVKVIIENVVTCFWDTVYIVKIVNKRPHNLINEIQ